MWAISLMQVKKLIAEFSTKEKLPIELKEVEKALRANGVEADEEIYYFYDVELPPDSFAGFVHSEKIPFGADDWRLLHTITYAKMGEPMERLVCCKEMLHILDPDYLKANTIETVNRLISEIILPPDFTNFVNNGAHANSDMIGIAHAIAVLMPLAAIEILRPALKAGKISIERIAEIAELPIFAVSAAMSDPWPDFHAHLVKRYPQVIA